MIRLVVSPRTTMGRPVFSATVELFAQAGDVPRPVTPVRNTEGWLADFPNGTTRITVRTSDPRRTSFEQVAALAVSPSGSVTLTAANPEVGPIAPPLGTGPPTVLIPVTLPRVRDVTANAAAILGRPWAFGPKRIPVISGPPSPSRLAFVPRTVTPGASSVLEVAGMEVPKLLSVTWPAAPPPALGPQRFLVYFHHRIGQNLGPRWGHLYQRDGQRYPWGRDFLEFGFMHYLDYARSPLSGVWGGKGLAYQLAAAGRSVAMVLPMPSFDPDDAGAFLNADAMREVLLEVAGHAQRRAGNFSAPVLDRVALASFSSGALDTAAFLRRNAGSAFRNDVVSEVYRFEGASDADWRAAAVDWAGRDGGKRIRVYRQLPWSAQRQAVYVRAGFARWPARAARTFASLTGALWRTIVGTTTAWEDTEAIIANTMLVDALRRSGF